jgi:O-antigen ligase
MNYQSKPKKLFYLLCMALYTTSVVLSSSRGGFVAMVSVAFLCWLAIKAKFKSLLIIAIATIAILFFAPPKFFREVKTLEQGTQEGTADQRIYLWGIALKMFYDHPILGVGLSNYPLNVLNYDTEERFSFEYYAKGRDRVAHSTPMQWLAETGVIGIIILSTLQIALYRNWKIIHFNKNETSNYSLKDHNQFLFKTISDACAITQVGFWVAALFLSLLPYPFYWCLIPFSETWNNLSLNYIKNKKYGLNP